MVDFNDVLGGNLPSDTGKDPFLNGLNAGNMGNPFAEEAKSGITNSLDVADCQLSSDEATLLVALASDILQLSSRVSDAAILNNEAVSTKFSELYTWLSTLFMSHAGEEANDDLYEEYEEPEEEPEEYEEEPKDGEDLNEAAEISEAAFLAAVGDFIGVEDEDDEDLDTAAEDEDNPFRDWEGDGLGEMSSSERLCKEGEDDLFAGAILEDDEEVVIPSCVSKTWGTNQGANSDESSQNEMNVSSNIHLGIMKCSGVIGGTRIECDLTLRADVNCLRIVEPPSYKNGEH